MSAADEGWVRAAKISTIHFKPADGPIKLMYAENVTFLFSSFQRYNLVSPITEQFDKSEAGIYETLFSKYIVLECVVSMKLR